MKKEQIDKVKDVLEFCSTSFFKTATIKGISFCTEISERKVAYILQKMVDAGEVEKVSGKLPNQNNKTYFYSLKK